jgi:hypothetical protein
MLTQYFHFLSPLFSEHSHALRAAIYGSRATWKIKMTSRDPQLGAFKANVWTGGKGDKAELAAAASVHRAAEHVEKLQLRQFRLPTLC